MTHPTLPAQVRARLAAGLRPNPVPVYRAPLGPEYSVSVTRTDAVPSSIHSDADRYYWCLGDAAQDLLLASGFAPTFLAAVARGADAFRENGLEGEPEFVGEHFAASRLARSDPVLQLLNHLRAREVPPMAWVARWEQGTGDALRGAWMASQDLPAMFSLAVHLAGHTGRLTYRATRHALQAGFTVTLDAYGGRIHADNPGASYEEDRERIQGLLAKFRELAPLLPSFARVVADLRAESSAGDPEELGARVLPEDPAWNAAVDRANDAIDRLQEAAAAAYDTALACGETPAEAFTGLFKVLASSPGLQRLLGEHLPSIARALGLEGQPVTLRCIACEATAEVPAVLGGTPVVPPPWAHGPDGMTCSDSCRPSRSQT